MDRIGALLLAAGESSRMGEIKALLPWRGTTLLEYQVYLLQKACLDPIIIVVGHRHQELESLVGNNPKIRCVYNPHYPQGKTTSIKAGLAALQPSETEAILVLNVDQPRSPETLAHIIEAHHHHNAPITVPTHGGKGGHPVVFSSQLLGELMEISEETQGLKAVVKKHEKETVRVEVNSSEVLLDLNTEQEYQRALEQYGTA